MRSENAAIAIESSNKADSAPTQESPRETPLSHRAWLALARVAWAVLSLGGIGIFVIGTAASFYWLIQPCSLPGNGQAYCNTVRASLAQLGISSDLYAAYNTLGVIVEILPWIIVGALIFRYISNRGIGLFFSLALILFGTTVIDETIPGWAVYAYPDLALPVRIVQFFGTSLAVVWYLFPDGRFMPKWTRWLAAVWVVRAFFLYFLSGTLLNTNNWVEPLPLVVVIAFIGSLAFSLLYRYRQADSSQRQQLKWIVVGAVVFALINVIGGFLPSDTSPATQLIQLIHDGFLYIGSLILAVSIGLAMLRYHLWNVDILLRRTLVYVPLTAILASIFAVSTDLSTKFFTALTGGQSDAATIVTTLIVVAAFEPVKHWLQELVDKNFKEAPDSTKRLKAVQSQMRSYLQMADAPEMTQHTLEEAVASFGAAGGAVYLDRTGEAQSSYTTKDWKGDAKVTIPFARNGAPAGRMELGARKDGTEYGETDRALLQQTVDLMERALALAERA